MNVCDLCGRTDRQAKCEVQFIQFDCEIRWKGHLCSACAERVADSLRTLIPSPSLESAPFVTPTPKQAYVMQPSWPWVARFALGVLIGIVSMAAGAAMTLSLIRH